MHENDDGTWLVKIFDRVTMNHIVEKFSDEILSEAFPAGGEVGLTGVLKSACS